MSSDMSSTLQALIDAQENPFVLIDEGYRVVAANSAYQTAYGVDPSAIVGRHCYEVSHHRDSPCWQHGEACPHHEVFGRESGGCRADATRVSVGYLLWYVRGGRGPGRPVRRLRRSSL